MKIVSRRPIVAPSAPPTSPPTGITPQTTNRREAFARPSIRSGVIAWIRLMAVTLKRMTPKPTTKPLAIRNGIARSLGATAIRSVPGPNRARGEDDRPAHTETVADPPAR